MADRDGDIAFVDYPRLRWPSSGWVLTAFGAICAAALLLFPSLTSLSPFGRALTAGGLLVLTLASAIFRYPLRVVRVAAVRLRSYKVLHNRLQAVSNERDQAYEALTTLIRERQESRTLGIAHCYYQDTSAFIALNRKRGLRVRVGDSLAVIDFSTGKVLGQFIISQDSGQHYIAKAAGRIDALWLGYLRQGGATHSAPPQDAKAILFVSETNNG